MKPSSTFSFKSQTFVDLTHPLNAQVATWVGSCGFQHILKRDHDDCSTQTKFRSFRVEMNAGIGTHMDAPTHCFPNGISIAEIPLKELVLPIVVLNVAEKADVDYQITVQDVLDFESKHGLIPSRSLVIGYTGWSRFWNAPEKYRNADSSGQVHFPTFSKEAAQILFERKISGIGIDTLSPDTGTLGYFPTHEIFLGAGKYIIENVANADLLPPVGAWAIALPLKIENGSEAPVRLIGFYEEFTDEH